MQHTHTHLFHLWKLHWKEGGEGGLFATTATTNRFQLQQCERDWVFVDGSAFAVCSARICWIGLDWTRRNTARALGIWELASQISTNLRLAGATKISVMLIDIKRVPHMNLLTAFYAAETSGSFLKQCFNFSKCITIYLYFPKMLIHTKFNARRDLSVEREKSDT